MKKYAKVYFENAVSSVYAWDLDDAQHGAFAACFCILKTVANSSWSCKHVFQVKSMDKPNQWMYQLTSTVFVVMKQTRHYAAGCDGEYDLSGHIIKQAEKKHVLDVNNGQSHLEIMGPMIEDLESDLCATMQAALFQKTKEIVYGMKPLDRVLRQ